MNLVRCCLLMCCSLVACANQGVDMHAPDPMPEMLVHNKLTYSSQTRSMINKFVDHVRNALEENHGQLSMENYQVDSNLDFAQIQAHYQALLEAGTNTWAAMDDPAFAWSDQASAAAWQSGDNVFIVLAVSPQVDTDKMPVQTLSNLPEKNR